MLPNPLTYVNVDDDSDLVADSFTIYKLIQFCCEIKGIR